MNLVRITQNKRVRWFIDHAMWWSGLKLGICIGAIGGMLFMAAFAVARDVGPALVHFVQVVAAQ